MKIEKQKDFITTLVSGNEMNTIKYILDTEKSGKTIYIQSGIHGGEITYWIINKLFLFLKENLLNGKVIFVPCANPMSWMQRSYHYTMGKFNMYNGVDWNRAFPGGNSLEGIVAEKLFNTAKEADFVFDLHTARDSKPFAIPSKEEYLSFCKTIGLEYNFLHIDSENIKYHGTINAQLDFANVPNLTIECGSHDEYCEEKINEVFDGIIRLLVEFGMVDKKFYKDSGVAVPKYFKKTKKITAMDGGYVQFHKNINDKFVKGDLLYSLYNPNSFGEKSDYFAEFDGVAWKFSITHIFMKGEDVVEAIPDSEIKAI